MSYPFLLLLLGRLLLGGLLLGRLLRGLLLRRLLLRHGCSSNSTRKYKNSLSLAASRAWH